jgi:hypothetical protein
MSASSVAGVGVGDPPPYRSTGALWSGTPSCASRFACGAACWLICPVPLWTRILARRAGQGEGGYDSRPPGVAVRFVMRRGPGRGTMGQKGVRPVRLAPHLARYALAALASVGVAYFQN